MSTFESMWAKFKRTKHYRDAFVAQHAKTEIGFQIRALLKQFGLTQKQLADRAGLTQGVVSRAADPSYGNLTINTLVRIAAGFDVAFVGRFVPFSELPKWFEQRKEEAFTVPSFAQEDASFQQEAESAAITSTELVLEQATTTVSEATEGDTASVSETIFLFPLGVSVVTHKPLTAQWTRLSDRMKARKYA